MDVVVSWSGGKDSCLALHKCKELSHHPKVLLSMIDERGYSKSNGVHNTILEKQAKSLNIPIVFIETNWNDYENKIINGLIKIKKVYSITGCVFGDIDIESHRKFEEQICKDAQILAILPLWGLGRVVVKDLIIAYGIKSKLSVIQKKHTVLLSMLGSSYEDLGFNDLTKHGIDVCGENGEFHTVVYRAERIGLDVDVKKGKLIYLR